MNKPPNGNMIELVKKSMKSKKDIEKIRKSAIKLNENKLPSPSSHAIIPRIDTA